MRDFIIILTIAAICTGVYQLAPKWECKRISYKRHGVDQWHTVCNRK